ncbi:MAG: DEAD/DEAH box helicase family protein [Gammaproteobacteria bacterium]|nr:DEAD/DEAH box helicase family protein [Gammaproteobacteria bacterium]MBT6669697.1 DEAD/DEAH box helicase family protein [Gammaproteobacteria bacterium]
MEFRPYQRSFFTDVRASFTGGEYRVVVARLPTGSGNTFIASQICKNAIAKSGRVWFICDRKQLVKQAYKAFCDAGLFTGVIQASHPAKHYHADVQVCSVQTLARRNIGNYPAPTLIIIDEAHILHSVHGELIDYFDKAKVIGLTATPYTRGMGMRYDTLVSGATAAQLTNEGWLVKQEVYAPTLPDLKGIPTNAKGDFIESAIGAVMTDAKLMADIVQTWIKHGENRPTLLFAPTVKASVQFVREFTQCGISAEHIDAKTEEEDRDEIFDRFQNGATKIISSVGTLTYGFDMPMASTLILARPTKSLSLNDQMLGRGARIAEGKTNCIVLDHAGNVLRHGFLTDARPDDLCDGKKNSDTKAQSKELLPRRCSKCKKVYDRELKECPACGHEPKKENLVSDLRIAEGELSALSVTQQKHIKSATDETLSSFFAGLLFHASDKGWSSGWAAHQFKQRFGVWPPSSVKGCSPLPPNREVKGWIHSQRIRYARGKQQRAESA